MIDSFSTLFCLEVFQKKNSRQIGFALYIANFSHPLLGVLRLEMCMWKWSVMGLAGVQAVWAVHHVVGYDAWSLFAGMVIALDIVILLAVQRMPK